MPELDKENDVFKFPVSPTQSAFWVINQLSPENPAYNIPLIVEIKGSVNADILQTAFNQLLIRHEILRTSYGEENGELFQYIHQAVEVPFFRRSFLSEGVDAAEKISDFLNEQAAISFDLSVGNIVRAGILEQDVDHYVFYLFIHHIGVDHAGVHQLSQELGVIYNALSQSLDPGLGEPDLQYVDYVMWQKEQAEIEGDNDGLALWQQKLEGFSGVLDLPTSDLRPAFPTGNGAAHCFALDKELSDLVNQFCRQQASSPYQVLLAVLKVLLARYSNQKDIIVGTPFAGRQDQEELQGVLGCFINTLPIATLLDASMTFTDLLEAVKKEVIFSFENQAVPFDEIANACIKHRDVSYNPVFQVGFVFQEPPADLLLNDLQCSNIAFHNGGAMYDMHLWMWQSDGQIQGEITFSTDVFSLEDIEHLVSNYKALLLALLKAPQESVLSIDLLSDQDHAVLTAVNATQTDLSTLPFTSQISAMAEQYGDDTAAFFATGVSLSYKALESRSNQLANVLVEEGVKPGDFVGLCAERNEYMLISLLAILKAGAAYVPLDPAYPEERLEFMVETAGVELLLMTINVNETLPDFAGKKISVDSEWSRIEATNDNFESLADADGLAYVIFTSGSTGKPKGVQVPHRAVSNFLLSMSNTPGLTRGDRLLAVTTLSFDIAVLELYLPLISGAMLVVTDKSQSSDGSQLNKLIAQHDINVMQATPSTWRGLLAAGFNGGDKFKVLCGGEAFPEDLARSLTACCGEVWNMYGPTETTVWSSCYQLPAEGTPVFIGKPIANTFFYVLDENFQQAPLNVSGELYIGGEGVTSGYLNRDDLTAERFISNPFGSGKIYRTGDLVRLRLDGEFEYCNRIDNQVKVRGFRIELGEVESVLNKHPDIAEVVVSVKQYSAIDQRLIAYVVFDNGGSITNTEMRRYLRAYLPDYMIPQLLVEMDSLPLMPNGKVDRSSLPEQLAGSMTKNAADEIQSPLQIDLAGIWSQHLGVENIRLTDSFIDLGGHSLLATIVTHQIESEFGVSVSPMVVFTNTLEQLAALLEKDINVSSEYRQTTQSLDTQEVDLSKKTDSFWNGFFKKLTGKA